MDLERYAQIYRDLGDVEIQRLLMQAAILSRERGRPEVMFIDTDSQKFQEQQAHIREEAQRRKAVQQQLVGFFLANAPVGARVSLDAVALDFNQAVGKFLSNDIHTGYLLLPTLARRIGAQDPDERLLLEQSIGISPQVKIRFNHAIRAAMRANLMQVGDIRNIMQLPPEVLSTRNLGRKTTSFLQQAFSQT